MTPLQLIIGFLVLSCIIFYAIIGYFFDLSNAIQEKPLNSARESLRVNNANHIHQNIQLPPISTRSTENVNNSPSDLMISPWHKIYLKHSWNKLRLQSEYNIDEKQMSKICNITFWNALKRTIYYSYIDNTTFVITGDIQDMWIRDSTEQIWPYFDLINRYKYIQYMIRGVILKQAQFILADVYANAFRKEAYCYDSKLQILIKTSIVATRDDEIDSGAYFIKLLYAYYYQTKDLNVFFQHDNIVKLAVIELINMWQTEQYHDTLSGYKTVTHGIKLNLPNVSYTGMVWSSHRPSDDLCQYPYHIADNFFIYQILQFVKYFATQIWHNNTMQIVSTRLQQEIYTGIHQFGVVNIVGFGDVYCYEVDGNGNYNLMDDANIPSLLSIPMISHKYNATIYNNTRKWLLSESNPYYFVGAHAAGIGSPHTPNNNIWPLALITQGFTSDDEQEKYELLHMLLSNTGGTGLMHESFNVDKDTKFTRKFFSWANSYFSIYAKCGEQFIDMYNAEVIKEKEESDAFLGSLSSIKEVIGDEIQHKNPNFVQWLKVCEKRGENKYIDRARQVYDKQVFNEDFLADKVRNKRHNDVFTRG